MGDLDDKKEAGLFIRIRGIVQGVGFRPFIYNLAVQQGLKGWVRNTSRGVEIEVNGNSEALKHFLGSINNQAPPLSRIDSVTSEPRSVNHFTSFEILESKPEAGDFIPISPDVTLCEDCRREMFDLNDRRYHYPFINCTNCGPRFTIIQDIPYDRPLTTMSGFVMCEECRKEYENPGDRRFHAQPIACPTCGPQLSFISGNKEIARREQAIIHARRWLDDGKIIAVKGLGGFHLACVAQNKAAVERLRERKQRVDKPFALMALDITAIEAFCEVNEMERKLLQSKEHPIVLLRKREDGKAAALPAAIAPGQNHLGFMLPYTPVHFLLMEQIADSAHILVMTSGNLNEEPIAYLDSDALERLEPLADGFLLNDRPIFTRVDDSVTRVVQNQVHPLRRSRGYAPDALPLQWNSPPILATGAEIKNTFCLTRDQYAFLSHHIGDMENFETFKAFQEGIAHFRRIFHVREEAIACDLHPNYFATRYAKEQAVANNLPLYEIQHHHAHLAACLADNHWQDGGQPVIGLCFDGTGYGSDGTIWGGEVLFGNYLGFDRLYHLQDFPLPGGDISVRKPARMALSILKTLGIDWDDDLPPVKSLRSQERFVLNNQLEKKINSPLTSSMGRLFDAAAALMGIRQEVNYEGQAAIEMENAQDLQEDGFYPLEMAQDQILPKRLFLGMIHDLRDGVPVGRIARRFHNSIARICLDVCRTIKKKSGCNHVALSGGVWQNITLFVQVKELLEKDGFVVLYHKHTPTNDGCIAFGQAVIVNYQLRKI